MENITCQIFDSSRKRKVYQTQALSTKFEVCGGTREALAIRRALFYSVARRMKQFCMSRVMNHQPPTARPTAHTANPFATLRPGSSHLS